MFLLLDVLAIIVYMADIHIRIGEIISGNFVGIAVMSALLFWVYIDRRSNGYVKLLELLVTSLPMSYIGIMGLSSYQFFSWYNLYLVLFLFYVLRHYATFSKRSIAALGLILLLNIIGSAWSNNLENTYIEIAQIFAMLIPLVLIYNVKERLPISLREIRKLIYLYADVCVATAIGMLVQFVSYYYVGIRIGILNFTGGNRISFYALFRGASILPIFMGVGFLILLLDVLDNRLTVIKSVKMAVIFMAMVLNTSRTGLAVLLLIIMIILLRKMRRNLNFKLVVIAISIFIAAVVGLNYILALRTGLDGFLDSNGRYESWRDGIEIWTATFKNFWLGEGFSGKRWDSVIKPHNVLVQTLAQCGVLTTIIVIRCFAAYFKKNRNNRYVYLPWFVLLSGMLVTDFYTNAFSTVIFMLVDIYGAKWEETMFLKSGSEVK